MAFNSQGSTLAGVETRTVTITATASPAKFIRATGSFLTDGFLPGMTFTTTATGNTTKNFTIVGVTALEITVTPAPTAVPTAEAATFTLSALIGELVSGNLAGGQTPRIDVTHLGSTARNFLPGLPEGGTFSGEAWFVPGDVGQIYLRKVQAERRQVSWRLKAASSPETIIQFTASVDQFSIEASVDEAVKCSFTLGIDGPLQWGDMP